MEKSGFSKAKCSSSCSNRNIWDCGSTLYDSYELNSFKRQLDSAIANSPRTLSMPHLPERDHHHLSLQPQPQPPVPSSHGMSNKSFKISGPFQKLLRFVFKSSICRSSSSTSNSYHQVAQKKYSKERFYVVYDKSEASVLSTIPELPEFDISSASERFTPTAIGISCA